MTDVVQNMIDGMRDSGHYELAGRWAYAAGKDQVDAESVRLLFKSHAGLSLAHSELEREHESLKRDHERLLSQVNRIARSLS